MTDEELVRIRGLLSTAESSLTELRGMDVWWKMLSACNRGEWRQFLRLVGALKLALPPTRN